MILILRVHWKPQVFGQRLILGARLRLAIWVSPRLHPGPASDNSVFLSKWHCIEKSRNGGGSHELESGMKKLNTRGRRAEVRRWLGHFSSSWSRHFGCTTIMLFLNLFFQPIHCLKGILKPPVHQSVTCT